MKLVDHNSDSLLYTDNPKVIVNVVPTFQNTIVLNQNTQFVWSYDVRIENLSPYFVQLISRYWKIIDANGFIEEVSSEGVIGLQPIIESGKVFDYSSQVKLYTNSGVMLGHYEMQDKLGNTFQVPIPAFSLDTVLEEMSIN